MGIGGFLVDLAAVLHASRSVASKHVALRARQLDRYSKTSSIAASLRARQSPGPVQSSEEAHKEPVSQQNDQVTHPAVRPEPEPHGSAQAGTPVEQPDSLSSPGLDAIPSLRIRNLLPRSRPQDTWPPFLSASVPALQDKTQESTQTKKTADGSGKSEFVPAPWSGLGGDLVHQTTPGPSQGRVGLDDNQTAKNEEPDSVPPGVDVNVFRTARGSRILGSLKVPEQGAPQSSKGEPVPAKPHPPAAEESHTKPAGQSGDGVLPAAPSSQPLESYKEAGTTATSDSQPPQPPEETDVREISTKEEDTSPNAAALDQQQTVTDPAKAEKRLTKEDADLLGELTGQSPAPTYELRESKVPATRLSRLWNYGGLAAGMFAGALGEGISRAVGGGGQGSVILSAGNMERLVAKLSRMRGAALKMGQMMSFQDSKMLPAPIQEVLQRVQDRADYMPAWQRDRVLVDNLGKEWRELFDTFEEKPIAAASIGQVHRATLRSNGAEVAIKIQFPGVADSINSDLDNLGILLTATRLLPKGLYLNKTIDNARTELAWECDYVREAVCGQRYRELLSDDTDVFRVPKIYPEACGKHVLTMEYMEGIGVTRVNSFTQEQRDWIGTQILRLCLREITEFKFMQTDPNWTNFLYNAKENTLELLDFGASREYPDEFISLYVRLLEAASRSDKETVKSLSEELGYLTGHESKVMAEAHITSVLTLAEPFLQSAPEVYDFRDQTITERVKAQIPVMIRERLAPPPEETYSLHRKLSGAFLLCARLGSRVRCRDLFEQALEKTDLVSK